jgi:hypothetical protein
MQRYTVARAGAHVDIGSLCLTGGVHATCREQAGQRP